MKLNLCLKAWNFNPLAATDHITFSVELQKAIWIAINMGSEKKNLDSNSGGVVS